MNFVKMVNKNDDGYNYNESNKSEYSYNITEYFYKVFLKNENLIEQLANNINIFMILNILV